MALDIGQQDLRYRHHLVERGHELGLGENWKLRERPTLESAVKAGGRTADRA
jgi:hypothetical protein